MVWQGRQGKARQAKVLSKGRKGKEREERIEGWMHGWMGRMLIVDILVYIVEYSLGSF